MGHNGDTMATRRSGTRLLAKEYRLAVYLRDRCRCTYCGQLVVPGAHNKQPNAATLEHIRPVACGGSNSYRNLTTCCAACNSSRGKRSTKVWFAVLRARGIDTAKLSARLGRVKDKALKRHLEVARQILAATMAA